MFCSRLQKFVSPIHSWNHTKLRDSCSFLLACYWTAKCMLWKFFMPVHPSSIGLSHFPTIKTVKRKLSSNSADYVCLVATLTQCCLTANIMLKFRQWRNAREHKIGDCSPITQNDTRYLLSLTNSLTDDDYALFSV